MTDHHDPDGRRTQELLRSLERDRTQVSTRRAEILDQVLAHYDRTRDGSETESNVLSLDDAPSLGSRRPLTVLRLGAAAILVAVVAIGAVIAGDRTARTNTDATERAPDADGEPAESATPPAGSMAGGDVTFDVVRDLELVELDEGLVLVGRDDTIASLDDAIVVVDIGPTPFADRVARLERDGLVAAATSTGLVAGRRVERWSIGIDPLGSDRLGCAINEPCLELVDGIPATALTTGTRATVTEVVGSGGSSVVFIVDENGSLRPDSTALLATVTIR